MEETEWDVVIVGGGSAGLSAALMLVRARRRVLVLDAGSPRNGVAAHMHGVLSRDGYPPLQLVADGRAEIEGYGGAVRSGTVVRVQQDGEPSLGGARFTVTTQSGERERARRLVIATGLRDELPEIEGLAEQWGRGVVVCPYCDGYEVRDARIGVIATGQGSVHQAQLLRQWSADLTYFTEGIGDPDEDQRRALDARGIRIDDRPIRRVLGGSGPLRGVESTDGSVVELDAIFTGPRPVPRDDLLRSLGATLVSGGMADGWVATDPNGATSVAGVWAVGNSVDMRANVPVSMGAGALAGGSINADLIEEDVRIALAAAETTISR